MTTGVQSEGSSGALSRIPGKIPPTAHRNWWIIAGLVLQLPGLGVPVFYVWHKAKHENVGGLITMATVKLAWHESLHAKAGIGILVGGAVAVAIGSVAVARPFVKHWVTLLVAVPIAALCGALVLGLAALIVVVMIASLLEGDPNLSSRGGSTKPQPDAEPQEPQEPSSGSSAEPAV